jgi:multiple sugar transport system permease protein
MTNSLPSLRRKTNWTLVLTYAILICGAVVSVLPFLYMILTAFKSYGSVITNNFWPWWPLGSEPLAWQNFPDAIKDIGQDSAWHMPMFLRYLINSLIVVSLTTAGALIVSLLAAYAFAFMRIPGKNLIFLLMLTTIMIPSDLTLVPKVVMMYNFKWYNTYAALVIPFTVSVFGIFLIRQFFLQIPKELFDAALIDGAGHLRFFSAIAVPLSRPAVITVALLNFIWNWDSFKWPFLVTRDSNMRVLAVGLQQFMVGEGGTQTQLLMAFACMVVVPVVVFYFFTQKYFMEGISRTGIKG